jgi:hypothetical protein
MPRFCISSWLCIAAAAGTGAPKCDIDPTTEAPKNILLTGGKGGCMGLYALSSKYHDNNKPVYAKMTANGKRVDKYLYYMTSYRMWVIGQQLAKAPFDMAVESSADEPSKVISVDCCPRLAHDLFEQISRTWVVMSSAVGGGSKEMPNVKSICARKHTSFYLYVSNTYVASTLMAIAITSRPTNHPTSNPTTSPSTAPSFSPSSSSAPSASPTLAAHAQASQISAATPTPLPSMALATTSAPRAKGTA